MNTKLIFGLKVIFVITLIIRPVSEVPDPLPVLTDPGRIARTTLPRMNSFYTWRLP